MIAYLFSTFTFICMFILLYLRLWFCFIFFFQAEDGIRDLVRSRGLGDVYKRQVVQRLGHRLQLGIDAVVAVDFGVDIR